MTTTGRARRRVMRAGVASFEAVLSLAVTFPMAWIMFLLGVKGLAGLYRVISSLVGSPEL